MPPSVGEDMRGQNGRSSESSPGHAGDMARPVLALECPRTTKRGLRFKNFFLIGLLSSHVSLRFHIYSSDFIFKVAWVVGFWKVFD